MASEEGSVAASRDKRRLGLALGMASGSLLVFVGACVYGLRLDRPSYELTPVEPTLHVSIDDDPDVGRRRTLTLAFQNIGRYSLTLAGVHTSCSCTVVGEVPNETVPPDGVVGFNVAVTLPTYGEKRTSLTVDTEPPGAGPVKVSLVMHGATVLTPYVNRMPESFELTTRRPDERVEYVIELETGEAANSEPWLTDWRPAMIGRGSS